MGYYTNGAYLVKGYKIGKTVRGKVVKTKYPNVYNKGEIVSFPIYDRNGDTQFYKLNGIIKKIELNRNYE